MNARARLVLVRNENPSPTQIQLEFSPGCPFTDSERKFLCESLAQHAEAQLIADEVAGQVRQRGRGKAGIKSPRALAALLARVAIAHGTESWHYWQDEEELRQVDQEAVDHKPSPGPTQPLALARPETLAAARTEARRIKERHAARQLQLLQGGRK